MSARFKKGLNDLASVRPDLIAEALFDATEVHSGSHKKLPWRCHLGHEFETQVNLRVAGSGCPYCANRLVWPGFNDLATLEPELAAEADFDATQIYAGSSKKMPWKCSLGHGWDAVVAERRAGTGCPVCAGKKVLGGFNDLASVNPKLAAEAQFDATAVTANSGRKLPWRCSSGHEWEATVASRSAGNGCPYCAGKRAISGKTDLRTTHPHLISEALFDPSTVSAGSEKKVPWRCPSGHEYESMVISRARQGSGCPVCANLEIRAGVNDLKTLRPDLAKEALFDATAVSIGSNKKLRWRCALGHEYEGSVSARTSRGAGCPYCANQAVLPGFNDLATLRPDLAAEALFDPTTVTPGSGKLLKWRCRRGHEFVAKPGRRLRGDGCQICSGHLLVPGVNDLATVHPEMAAQAVIEEGFDPTKVTPNNATRFKWRCSLGHEWLASPNSRVGSGSGCPVCSGQRLLPGFNDLATANPQLVAEALFDATTVSAGSSKKRKWRCHLGHDWLASPAQRSAKGSGCPYCSGRDAWPGFNDLATTHPELAREMVVEKGFDPTTFVAGSGRKALWRCDQGHEWKAVVGSRATGTGCPACAKLGFDPTQAAWLYLMRHENWMMLQVGITNDLKTRLAEHSRKGWTALDVRGPMDGVLAQDWERAILKTLHRRHIEVTPSGVKEQPSRTGSKRRVGEAWWEDEFAVSTIKELMKAVESDES